MLVVLHTTANMSFWLGIPPCLLSLRLLFLIPVDVVVVVFGLRDDVATDVVGDSILKRETFAETGNPAAQESVQ